MARATGACPLAGKKKGSAVTSSLPEMAGPSVRSALAESAHVPGLEKTGRYHPSPSLCFARKQESMTAPEYTLSSLSMQDG